MCQCLEYLSIISHYTNSLHAHIFIFLCLYFCLVLLFYFVLYILITFLRYVISLHILGRSIGIKILV